MNPINMLKGMMGNMNPRNIAMQLLGQNNNQIFNITYVNNIDDQNKYLEIIAELKK